MKSKKIRALLVTTALTASLALASPLFAQQLTKAGGDGGNSSGGAGGSGGVGGGGGSGASNAPGLTADDTGNGAGGAGALPGLSSPNDVPTMSGLTGQSGDSSGGGGGVGFIGTGTGQLIDVTGLVTGGAGGAPAAPNTGAGGGGAGLVLLHSGTVNISNGAAVTGGLGGTAADGGGGWGGAGLFMNDGGTLNNFGTVQGGDGGNGTIAAGIGGTGLLSNNASVVNSGLIKGGTGGTGGVGGPAGLGVEMFGGDLTNTGTIQGGNSTGVIVGGGAGVFLHPGASATVTNSGMIQAGSSTGGTLGSGVGISAANSTLINTGTIIGGVGVRVDGSDTAIINSGSIKTTGTNAVELHGNNDRLELQGTNYSFIHSADGTNANVVASGTGAVLALGGAADSSFSVVGIGSQYQGFTSYEKTGTSTWTLTGTTTQQTNWTLTSGTLSIADAASLGGSASTLTLNGGTLQATNNSNAVVLTHGLTLGNNGGTLDVTNDNGLSVEGIAGTGGFTKTGAGILQLSGTNSYSGATTIQEGSVLAFNLDASFSAFTVKAGGTLAALNDNTIGSLAGDGSVLLLGSLSTGADNKDTTFSGVIDDQGGFGSFAKIGTGTLTLTGNNSYHGVTTVNGGTLLVNSSIGSLVVNANGTIGGTGAVGGTVIGSGGTLAPGAPNSIGTLNVNGNLKIEQGGKLAFDFGAPGANFSTPGASDKVAVTGNLTIDQSSLIVNDLGGMGPGLYTLISWTGAYTQLNGGLAVPGSLLVQEDAAAKTLNLVNPQGLTLNVWNPNGVTGSVGTMGGDGTWSTNSATWSDVSGRVTAPMQPQPGFAIFGGQAGAVTVSGAVSATGMQFRTDGYTLSGGDIKLIGSGGNSPSINVDGGVTATINSSLSGTDGLSKDGGGTLVLGGVNTYSGGTNLNSGVLSISQDSNLGATTGNTLTFNGGILQFTGGGGGLDAARTIKWGANGGGFDVVGFASGFQVGQNLDGTGSLTKLGQGILLLSGVNSYSGATVIDAGMLLAGSSTALSPNSAFTINAGAILNTTAFDSTLGSLAGAGTVDLGGMKLTTGGDNRSTQFSGVIDGAGSSLVKEGTGVFTLSGTNTYTGTTTVNGGTLNVDGSIASSSLTTVNAGGKLGGNGIVGATTINGGTLAPGADNAHLTINGDLTFTAAAAYLVQVSPLNAGLVTVNGTAHLADATVNANFASAAPNTYVEKQYTILTANAIDGSFSGPANTNLPANFKSSLSQNTNNVYLNLTLDFSSPPSGPSGPSFGNALSGNQQSVGNAIVNYFNTTGHIPMAFGALTQQGLTQISGELGSSPQQTSFQASTQFMNIMGDVTSAGRGGDVSGGGASGYADEEAMAYAGRAKSKSPRDAFAAFTKAPPRDAFDPRWSVWASGFGGSQTTDGNAVAGTSTSSSNIYGVAVGADYRFSPDTVAGFALAGGGTNSSVVNGGTGRSDLFQAGAFVRQNFGATYLTASAAYGWQDVTTDRTITAAGADHLRAEFNANSYSGRLELGHRFLTPWFGGLGVSPYAAAQVTAFELPSYAERAISGANTFALSYGGDTTTSSRTELGLRTDKSYALDGAVLTLRGRAAWAHDFDPDHAVTATFQSLPGASFVVNGAALASDTALTTASAEVRWLNGWSVAATLEGEFSDVTRSYAGKGVLRYNW